MPDIKLGPQGEETTLPPINWRAPGDRELPIGLKKNVETAGMLDGGKRALIKSKHQRTFELAWDLLVLSDVLTLRGLADLNQKLRYQDNRLDSTWRWVYVAGLDVNTIETTQAATPFFSVAMTLEEAE